jgi:hypothetical protein
MKIPVLIVPATLLLSSALLAAQQGPTLSQKCEALAKLNLPNVTITTAKAEAAGEFAGPRHPFTGADISAFYKQLPAFCRIVAKAHPSSDSDITIEVWMPLDKWNGKLQGLANGGFAGAINYLELGASLQHGYVATGTDTGHSGSPIDAAWALGHPEKIIDFGYRGIHEMTRVAKLVIPQFYGSAPKRSYFAGCSDGGREALMEAQRYPDDYDGILAGAPANYWTGLLSLAVVDTQAVTATPASFIPPAKVATIGKAVVAACDKLDGVADGVLNDPRQCASIPPRSNAKKAQTRTTASPRHRLPRSKPSTPAFMTRAAAPSSPATFQAQRKARAAGLSGLLDPLLRIASWPSSAWATTPTWSMTRKIGTTKPSSSTTVSKPPTRKLPKRSTPSIPISARSALVEAS